MNHSHAQLIHALLFTSGETWKFSELADALKISKSDTEKALAELADTLASQAIIPLIHNESVTLVTKPELKEFLETMENEELSKEFSKGALETLALIAYKGPMSKSDIDYIRGVNSQFMLRNLFLRGMIEKQSGSRERGSSYVISADALRFLGVTEQDKLPNYEQFQEEITKRIPVTSE
jgi:segregation and condensation protein B